MSIFSLTRKADYGLAMLSELAKKGKNGLVSVATLSVDRDLPKAFLAQIGQSLKQAGIVGSKEGRNGGYFLLYEPNEIEVKEALEAIEGEISPTVCTKTVGCCSLSSKCEHKDFMVELATKMQDVLSGYTLADLI